MLSLTDIIYLVTVLGYTIKLSELTDPVNGMSGEYRDLILNNRFVALMPFPLDLIIIGIAKLFKLCK